LRYASVSPDDIDQRRSAATKEEIMTQCRTLTLPGLTVVAICVMFGAPTAYAEPHDDTVLPNNKRLNDGVVANVYTMQHNAGCMNDVRINPQLQHAAEQHATDVLNNRNLDGDTGSDGSTPQDRANAAGFHGKAAETVAINQSIAISGNDLINRWYYNPAYSAIMTNCANSEIGVWTVNSPDRTVVVAMYGTAQPVAGRGRVDAEPPPAFPQPPNVPLDPAPDYDGSDELEFGIDWFPWILRGVYPPPAYPPN
jgi:uncharacterized protein YkwD